MKLSYNANRFLVHRLFVGCGQVVCPPEQQHYPMFYVDSGRHSDTELTFDAAGSERVVRMSTVNRRHHPSVDEFTLL